MPASSPRRVAVPIARKERRRLDSSETWRSTCFRDIICSYFWRGKLVVNGEEGDWRGVRVDCFPGDGVDEFECAGCGCWEEFKGI